MDKAFNENDCCCENRTECMNTVCQQNSQTLNVEAGSTYNNRCSDRLKLSAFIPQIHNVKMKEMSPPPIILQMKLLFSLCGEMNNF